MGKKGKKAAKVAADTQAAGEAKKICSNCGAKVGSGDKKLSKCGFCETTRYCSMDYQRAHWKVRAGGAKTWAKRQLVLCLTSLSLASLAHQQEHKAECNDIVAHKRGNSGSTISGGPSRLALRSTVR
jgi:hypothetical protein